MKNLFRSLLSVSLMLAVSSSFAQSKQESHTKLTEHHTKTTVHTENIKNGNAMDKESRKKNAEEAGSHLETSKTTHMELKKTMPEKYKAVAKPQHEAIEKHHAEATKHHRAMTAEISKENADDKKVKEHAANMHTSTTNAEIEHQKLIKNTSK